MLSNLDTLFKRCLDIISLPVFSLSIFITSEADSSNWQLNMLDFDSVIPLDLINSMEKFYCQNLAVCSHHLLRVSTQQILFG